MSTRQTLAHLCAHRCVTPWSPFKTDTNKSSASPTHLSVRLIEFALFLGETPDLISMANECDLTLGPINNKEGKYDTLYKGPPTLVQTKLHLHR